MSEEQKKIKKKGGRPQKFDGKSKVISFRIDKNMYGKYNNKIRKEIDGVIEEEK